MLSENRLIITAWNFEAQVTLGSNKLIMDVTHSGPGRNRKD